MHQPPQKNNQHLQVQSQQRRAGVNMRRAQLTLDELSAVPDAAPMFRSVGKAYFLAPKQELVGDLEADIKASKDQLAELQKQAERAQKGAEDIQNELREVARDNPKAVAAFQRAMGGAAGGA